MGIRATVRIRVVEGLSSALVTGFFRVVVLVPAAMATGMAPAAIEAILAHEFAHIRRWDHWVNGFQRLVETLLFFHPAVWWISRRIRVERELCCDAMVLEAGADRATYARALLALAEASPGQPAWALSSQGGNLRDRIRAILHGPAPGEGPAQGRLAAALVALAVMVLPFAVTLYSNLSHAQELPERVLRFPSDRSVGTVYGRWADEDYRTVPWMPDHNEGWTVLAPARGDVVVPENTLVKLTVGTTDLAYLRQLDPDAVYFLDARYQKLTDEDIAPIGTLAGLRALDLSDATHLSGACLGQLGALTELEWLDFQRTPIDGLPLGAIAQFPALQFVAAHFKHYGSQAIEEIVAIDQIAYVCIKESSLHAGDMERLSGMDSLRALILDNVQLTNAAFESLRTAPNLLYLDLKKNPLSDDVLADFDRFPRLRHLDLENTGVGDAGVAYLRDNPTLQQIFLSNTPVTEDALPTLASLPALRAVKLVETGVSDAQAGVLAATLSSRPGNQVRPQQSSNPDAPRVGLLMSHYTATGPHWISRPYGYINQETDSIARALNEANFDVYAVVEPGTEVLGELPGILHAFGLSQKTVNGFDTEALEMLDVVFLSSVSNVHVAMLEALDTAIRNGVGLVNVSTLGVVNPSENHPLLESITGIEHARYTWQGFKDSTCPILHQHPILGGLKVGTTFTVNTLNGCRTESGVVHDATILLGTPADYPETFPVLYVRNHGQGRVVRAQWHRPHQPGIPLPGFTFYVRCINWAAGRDANAVW